MSFEGLHMKLILKVHLLNISDDFESQYAWPQVQSKLSENLAHLMIWKHSNDFQIDSGPLGAPNKAKPLQTLIDFNKGDSLA